MRSRGLVLLVVAAAAVLSMAQAQSRAGVPVDIAPLVETEGVRPGDVVRVALHVELPEGFHVQSNAPKDPTYIATALAIDPPAGVEALELVFPASSELRQQGIPEPLLVFDRRFLIGARLRVAPTVAPGEIRVPARFRYQACDDRVCYYPITREVVWTLKVVGASEPSRTVRPDVFGAIGFGGGSTPPPPSSVPPARATLSASPPAGDRDAVAMLDGFDIRAREGGYLAKDDFLQFVRDAEAGVTRPGLFAGRGPAAILAIVFLGGLALNLTPCVLPMIPINLAIIGAGAHAGRRRRGLALGATYGGAMAVVYGALGLVVILTAGTFGTINASPWFNAGIAALFVLLGLAMFDFVTIDFSRLGSRIRFDDANRGTFLLAFGMGAVAALLAGACVAPVVIQVVLFASDLYASGNASALALPFVLGLGMALPWPVAGAGIASLPRPGAWMVRVKYAFGVFILATAAYYGYVAYGLFANRWVDPASVRASVEEKLKAGWHASLADGLAEARRDGKPVLIDLWATWCKNCLTMDRTTLADPDVVAALDGYTRIKVQAEDLGASPTNEIMEKLGAIGLPTYVILHAK
jgi:cytochrome c biogenesis protein CcdA/thiol-disulfide isomerase/thioredoxin